MGILSIIKAAPGAVVRATGKAMFALKSAKPQLLVGGGIMIATGAFVLAIVNARKMDRVMAEGNNWVEMEEKAKADYIQLNQQRELPDDEKTYSLTIRDYDRKIRKAKFNSVRRMFVLMGVPTLAFAGGIAMTVGGHIILFRRFGQLSVSFAALKESFDRYRAMNVAEHGEECDRRYIYGATDSKTVTEKITDDDGKEKNVKVKLPVIEGDKGSLYSFEFSEAFSRKCPKDPVNTISFLRSQEKYWNTWMKATGKPVTLDMVLDGIGIELDPDDPMNDYTLIAGWRPNGEGDNEIDFGIMRAINKKALGMEENVVMLNFNCDGNIYHSIRYDKNGRKIIPAFKKGEVSRHD